MTIRSTTARESRVKVVVVGGGLAGFMAAIAADQAGAEVTLISRAPGATALYGGIMEIVPGPGPALDLASDHPLARLGLRPGELEQDLEEACKAFVLALGRAGLELQGDAHTWGVYADLRGRPHGGQLVPATVAAGELGRLAGRRLGVIGIEAVSEYDAVSAAEALRELAGVDAVPVSLSLPGLPSGASVADLAGRPAPRPSPGQADVFAYPPGLTDLPAESFELLAWAPSAHGWRLQQALDTAFAGQAVTCVRAEALGFDRGHGQVLEVRTASGSYPADSVVLATGRFIGGGLVKQRLIQEPLLGLPVFCDGEPLETAYWPRIRHLEYISSEPAFRSGLRTDPDLRPLGPGDEPVHTNLRAAGSLLAGWQHSGGFGFGVPLLTGWRAGRSAAAS